MSKARGGLGRGLGALIPTATPVTVAQVPGAAGVTGSEAADCALAPTALVALTLKV